MNSITKQQIVRIKTLQRKLGMSDEVYRDILSQWNVASCKDLSYFQAAKLIETLLQAAGQPSRAHGWGQEKYNDLKRRKGSYLASAKQLRMIEAMWRDVCRRRNEIGREMTLQSFVRRMVKVDDLLFVDKSQVKILVKAMEEMRNAG